MRRAPAVRTVEFLGEAYPVRTVAAKDGTLLDIGTLALSDALVPDELCGPLEGYSPLAPELAREMDEGIFQYVEDDELGLPEAELKKILKESNPDMFE